MKKGHPRESALSKKKRDRKRIKVGLIPIIVFILVIIGAAALVIPQSLKLEDQETARAASQGHR